MRRDGHVLWRQPGRAFGDGLAYRGEREKGALGGDGVPAGGERVLALPRAPLAELRRRVVVSPREGLEAARPFLIVGDTPPPRAARRLRGAECSRRHVPKDDREEVRAVNDLEHRRVCSLPHTLLCRQILGVLHLADAQESTLIRRGAIRDPPGLDKAKRSVFDEQPRVDAAPPRFREGRRILSPELCLGFFDCTCLGSACDQRVVLALGGQLLVRI